MAFSLNTHGRDPKWIERGEAAYHRALQLDPKLADALSGSRSIFYAHQQARRSHRYALQAIERKPDCEGVYNVLGRAYFASGRFQDAADLVERAIEANGDDYNIYIPYTNALDRLGKTDKARRFREMEVLDPRTATRNRAGGCPRARFARRRLRQSWQKRRRHSPRGDGRRLTSQ